MSCGDSCEYCFTSVCFLWIEVRAKGKHFYVYTVAGSAQISAIYYAKVKRIPERFRRDRLIPNTMAMLHRSISHHYMRAPQGFLPGWSEYVAGPLAMPISYPVLFFF